MAETDKIIEAVEAQAEKEVNEAVNPQADAPKKNAVAAEPTHLKNDAEDLGAAVVKPTDSNPDATKKVNQVSGDPAQASQGSADAMPKLKEEEETADEKKSEVKEGEMPQAALDALKKSQDKKDTKEEDEKKEIKSQKDHDKKDVKEEDEKEKKEIKASAKEKVKDMDMKEDVAALTDGEELSEEFKAKAATIFESAVKAKLVEEIEKLEGEYESKVAEKVEESKSEIVEKVDAYLNYVVESWMKDNELAIEKGLKSEITEDFIGGMKKLFETHYIDLPDSKFDVVEDQAATIVKLKEDMNKTLEMNVELNQKIGEFARDEIINDVSSDLAETEKEKLKGLAESIEYVDAADYRGKVETLKNSYFPAQKASDTESNEVAATENMTSDVDLSESMAAYTAAISKNQAKKLY